MGTSYLFDAVLASLHAHHSSHFCCLVLALSTGCSNVIRSGLMNSNTIFLDPNTNRSIYTQLRNVSENQQVTLSEVNTKLTAKGYQLVQEPEQANYWIQAKVIYCHKTADGVTPESVAKSGAGAGISSGGTAMVSAGSMNDGSAMGMAGMPDMSAMMRQAMAMSGGRAGFGGMSGFSGMQETPKEDGITYSVRHRHADHRSQDGQDIGSADGKPNGSRAESTEDENGRPRAAKKFRHSRSHPDRPRENFYRDRWAVLVQAEIS